MGWHDVLLDLKKSCAISVCVLPVTGFCLPVANNVCVVAVGPRPTESGHTVCYGLQSQQVSHLIYTRKYTHIKTDTRTHTLPYCLLLQFLVSVII